jgi:hypothetical protein
MKTNNGINSVNWNILVTVGNKIKRVLVSSGERKSIKPKKIRKYLKSLLKNRNKEGNIPVWSI